MSLAIILGTRLEIIKMSPIIREYEQKGLDYFILHTGQHYSYEMDRIFFEQMRLPDSKYNLDVGSGQKSYLRSDFLTFPSSGASGTHGEQTGKIMIGVEQVLLKEMPDAVLIQGDT